MNKYRNWLLNKDNSIQTEVSQRCFQVTVTSDATYRAKFDQAQHVQLSNTLLDVGTLGGTVTYESTTVPLFDDYDYKNKTSSINSNVPNGTIGFNWCWQSWSDGTTSQARNIILDQDKNLQGLYKAHLGSSTQQATSSTNGTSVCSNGRKISVGIGATCAVYVSNGSIWYSSNAGSGWSNEVNIGYGKNPSIDAISGPLIAWEVDYGGSRDICLSNLSTPITWGSAQSYDATPVVAKDVVVWRGLNGLYVGVIRGGIGLFTSTDGQSQLPSVTCEVATGTYHLVYMQGNQIKHRRFLFDGTSINDLEPAQTVTSASGITNPTVSAYSNVIGVAWEGVTGTNHKVYYSQSTDLGASWSTPVVFTHGSESLSQPTLGMNANTIYLLFNCGGQVGRVSRPIGSSIWSSIVHIGKGNGIYIPSNLDTDPSTIKALWTNGTGVPYSINTNQINAAQQMSGTISSDATWSGVITVTGTVTVNAGVTLTITPGSSIAFSGSSTSLVVNGVINAQGTATEPIQFTSASDPSRSAWYSITVQNGNSIFKNCIIENSLLGLYLLNATTGSRVWVENCRFQNNNYGVTASHCNVTVKSCEVTNNNYGVWCNSTSDVKLVADSIHHNTYQGIHTYTSNVVQLYGTDIEYNGTYGLYTANSDVVHLGQIYNWEAYNTIRYNGNTELYAYSGGPTVTISSGSIHDNSGTEVYNYSNNPTINTNNCYWDANGCQSTGSIALNQSYNSLPTWDGQTRTVGSPLGKVGESVVSDSLPWIDDPRIPDSEKVTRCKNIIAHNPQSDDAKTALIWLYGILRADYLNNELGEKEKFFSYVRTLKQNFGSTALGKQAHRYMKIWKMLEGNDDAVIKLSQEALKFTTGDDSMWTAIDLSRAYARNGQVKEAKAILQELQEKYNLDQELIDDIRREVIETENLLAKGIWQPQKEEKSTDEDLGLLTTFALVQNFPNPFNPTTTINYQLPNAGHVTMKVFDMLGREVATLVDGMKDAGYYAATFDGSRFSSGVYFVRMITLPQDGNAPFTKTMKMLMMK